MRRLALCDVPWIAIWAIAALYLTFVSRSHWGIAMALVLLVVLIVWHLASRKSCDLPGPGPDDKTKRE